MPSMNAAAAMSAYKANHAVSPLAIADTAAALLANITGLGTLHTAGKIASVTVTGRANTVTSYQASQLAGLDGITVAADASLVVVDTAASLLNATRATGVALATTVLLSGANTVSGAQATLLAAMPGFALAAGNTTLVVSDTGANLASATYASGLAVATSKVLTGDSIVDVAGVNMLAGLGNLSKSATAVLHVEDSAANLLTFDNATGLGLATYVLLTGSNTVTAAQATALSRLPRFGSIPGATLTVSDTAANVLGNLASIGKYANATLLTGQNTITAAQMVQLSSIYSMSLASGGSLTVADTYANIQAARATIAALNKPAAYGIPAATQFVESQVSIEATTALQAAGNVTSFSVNDSSLHLGEGGLLQLGVESKLTGIAVTDTNPIALSYSDYARLSDTLGLIDGTYSVSVSGVPYLSMAAVNNDPHVATFTVTDTTALALVASSQLGLYSKASGIVLPFDPTQASSYAAFYSGSGTTALGPNRVINGSFENPGVWGFGTFANGSLPGWTSNNNEIEIDNPGVVGQVNEDGDNSAELNGSAFDTITQTVSGLVVGQTYQLSWIYGGRAGTGNERMDVSVNGTTVAVDTSNGVSNLGWQTNTVDLVATSSSATLSFAAINVGGDASAGNELDAVALNQLFSSPNLIANGSFESGGASWISNNNELETGAASTYSLPNYDGGQIAELNGSTFDTISQTVSNLVVGQAYQLGWAYGGRAGSGNQEMDVLVNGTKVGMDTSDGVSNLGWVYSTVSFVATATSEVVSFSAINVGGSSDVGNELDDITLNAVGADPGGGSFSLTGVPLSAVSGLASDRGLQTFTITDTAANFTGNTSALAWMPKLTGITVTGTGGGDTIDLTDVTQSATISLGGNSAFSAATLGSPTLSFIGSVDAITLGTGASTVDYTMARSGGIETVAGFAYGTDTLDIDLQGASRSQIQMFDTQVGGQAAISITSTSDTTRGVVLLGTPSSQTAADLFANHTTVINGHMFIT